MLKEKKMKKKKISVERIENKNIKRIEKTRKLINSGKKGIEKLERRRKKTVEAL